jgi:hypothetical protein
MRNPFDARFALRAATTAATIAFGLLAIVGSGGGAIGIPSWDGSSPAPLPPEPGVSISPGEPTVQAGTPVTFQARTYNALPPYTFQWRRGGVDIAGATGDSYLLNGAQAGDDLASFQVVASTGSGVVTGFALLHVSPLPPIVFEDTSFPVNDWAVTATPSSNGPTYTAAQSTSAGDPAPARLIVHQLPAGISSLDLVHTNSAAVYSPAVQGAIYTIDYTIDCAVVARSAGLAPMDPQIAVTFEQAGRLYRLGYALSCPSTWSGAAYVRSVQADRIAQLSGPACATGDRCPDFTAAGGPLRFGFATWVRTASSSAAGTLDLGIDNWKVTVWRK